MGRRFLGGLEEYVYPKWGSEVSGSNPEAVRRSVSVGNILNVGDIGGASPSVASEKSRNVMRAKTYLEQANG